MNNRHVYWLAAVLVLIGSGLFLFKVWGLGFPVTPGAVSEQWDVELRARFDAKGVPVKLSVPIPENSSHFLLIDENFVSRGYGLASSRVHGNRRAVWSIRQASGQQTLYYRAIIQRTEQRLGNEKGKEPGLAKVAFDEAHLAAAHALLADVRGQSADLESLVGQLLQHLANAKDDTDVSTLLAGDTSPLQRVRLAASILALENIPARPMLGIQLVDNARDVPLLSWLEVYDGRQWLSFQPQSGEAGLPDDFLVLWRGPDAPVQLKGGRRLQLDITVRRTEQAGLQAAASRSEILNPTLLQFSLLSLPVQTQEVYRVLLMIPIGAFLVVVLRNVVGVTTFGTFMPVLIALAFRETQLLWGIALFTLVVALGLAVRFYLDRLKLLLVPRLSAVLIVVVLTMAMISIFSHKLGLERGLSVALFPMVILTMSIERMSIVWEERGPAAAFKQGLGSLVVAVLAYLVMETALVSHLVLVFPEVLLILLACILLLGRYSGLRLLELRRFRALAEADK